MIAVTGATGHFGRVAIETLLKRGVKPADIVAVVRNPGKAADLVAQGLQVRRADYNEPDALVTALASVEKLIFVSSSELVQRIAQHQNVVNAARSAGVRLVAYTSAPRADSTRLILAADHKATEQMIRQSGIPFVFLRNSWYLEVYTAQLAKALDRGAIAGCADDGRISAAARADFAEAAAVVVTSDGHENRIYELGGDEAFTLSEFAAEVTRQSGRTVVYSDMPEAAYVATLVGQGIPEPTAHFIAGIDAGIARGDLYVDSHDLSRLIGRPTTRMADAVGSALKALGTDAARA